MVDTLFLTREKSIKKVAGWLLAQSGYHRRSSYSLAGIKRSLPVRIRAGLDSKSAGRSIFNVALVICLVQPKCIPCRIEKGELVPVV